MKKIPHGSKILGLVILIFFLVGCSILENKGLANGKADRTPTVGLVLSAEGLDAPYQKTVWEGLQKTGQKFNLEVDYVLVEDDKDYPTKLKEMARQNYELIFTLGPQAVAAVLESAANNPEIKYICLDASLENPLPKNVLGVSYRVEEAAFLAGYLAGKTTRTNVIGFISGDNKETAQTYYYAYKAGVKYASPYSEMLKGVAATYTDKERVKVMTERMVASKADVIFHAAGSAGEGMIEVLARNNRYAIGSDIDQSYLAPDRVLTSVLKNSDRVILKLLKQFKEKNLELGKNLNFGLKEEGVSLADFPPDNPVPEIIGNNIENLKQKIIDGSLVVPKNEEEYNKYMGN